MRKRFPYLVILAAAALLATAAQAPAPAQAEEPEPTTGDIICTVSNSVTFEPGLRLVEQQTHIEFHVGYSNCTSTSHPDVVSGGHSGTFDGPRGCLSLPPSHAPTLTVTWNTGETSTIKATASGYDVGGQSVHTMVGTVIDGLFQGALFGETIAQVNPKLIQCLTPPGVTSQTGVGTVIIG